MLRRRQLLVTAPTALCAWRGAVAASAAPPELAQTLPDARLQGEGRMRFLGLRIYDIRLWAPRPVTADTWGQAPLALELAYARTLYGSAIAERSLDEMRRQGEISASVAERWLGEMTRLFPDVKEGDRLTGLQQPNAEARFFYNGAFRGKVADAAFTRRFFGIWLAPETSEPSLREQLLAGAR
ncbi:MAG: chalcone isomerase family protein [Burkholderiaceae bacterium]|nr:chalcone isomerase family protein [Burkholderiaceae bacterium]